MTFARGECCQFNEQCHPELSLFCYIVPFETILFITGVASRSCQVQDVIQSLSSAEATLCGSCPGVCIRWPEV